MGYIARSLTGWITEFPVKPNPQAGCYVRPDGSECFPAHRLIDWAYPPDPARPARNNLIRAACSVHARHLAGHGPALDPMAERWLPARAEIERLVGHAFWSRLEVLAAPAHAADLCLPLATTIDLVVRFTERGDTGVASIQTAPRDAVRSDAVAAELGAALVMIGDREKALIDRSFVIWLGDGRVELEMIDANQACIAWVDAIGLSRWAERNPTLAGPGHLPLHGSDGVA